MNTKVTPASFGVKLMSFTLNLIPLFKQFFTTILLISFDQKLMIDFATVGPISSIVIKVSKSASFNLSRSFLK